MVLIIQTRCAPFCVALLFLLRLVSAGNHGAPLKQQWPWYHSGDELSAEFRQLVASCSGGAATISTVQKINSADHAGEEVNIDVFRLRDHDVAPKVKALLVFGEHARELITGETALSLAKALCNRRSSSEDADRALAGIEFVIVPNANPLSRKEVENGYYCKRTNEDGVDLNRNWSDEHRDTSKQPGDETYPGPSGFSEPETQILKELVDQEQPDIYLSVHSGAYLLGTPYGYEQRKTDGNDAMLEVLRPISEEYCGGMCPYGDLASLIHYKNPGCDIDYVYSQLKTPYVFTWEIYVGDLFRGRYEFEARKQHPRKWRPGAAFERKDNHESQGMSFSQRLRGKRTALALEAAEPEADEDITSCMDQFNPHTPEETTAVASRWTAAILALCGDISRRQTQK